MYGRGGGGVQGTQWEIDQLGGTQWETPDAARRAATPVGTEWETPEAALWAAAPAGTEWERLANLGNPPDMSKYLKKISPAALILKTVTERRWAQDRELVSAMVDPRKSVSYQLISGDP